MNRNILTVVGITILFLGICIAPTVAIDNVKKSSLPVSNGNTLYVGGTGPDNYTKIQDAIDNASIGDTVFVYDESSPYYENVVVDKSIFLIGENKDTTVIDGSGIKDVVYISADEVHISGFTMQNSGFSYPFYAGIEICSISNTITDNLIRSNQDGIYLNSSYNNTIMVNTIVNNDEDGIRLRDSDNNIITSNTIQVQDFGIATYYSNSNTIIDNDIRDNAVGIHLWGRSNTVTGNIIESNWAVDIWVRYSRSNTIQKNIVCSNNRFGIWLQPENTLNTITDNTISNHQDGINLGVYSHRNTVKGNIISDNLCGINISSSFNVILKNNFLNNERHAFFSSFIVVTLKINLSKDERRVFSHSAFRNHWLRNYWEGDKSLPVRINGMKSFYITNSSLPNYSFYIIWEHHFSWVNFDWLPAKEPYDI